MNELQDKHDAWLDKRTGQLERRIMELVHELPTTDHGKVGVEFSGDPRGSTVILVLPDDYKLYV